MCDDDANNDADNFVYPQLILVPHMFLVVIRRYVKDAIGYIFERVPRVVCRFTASLNFVGSNMYFSISL